MELQTAHGIEVDNYAASGERETSRGLNQIGNLQRSGSTRWSSHFNCICSLIDRFGSIITLLENINNCSSSSNYERGEDRGSLKAPKSFDFLFMLYLMHKIMGLTNLLCRALQDMNARYMDMYPFCVIQIADISLEELRYRFDDDVVQLLRLSTSLEPNNNFRLLDIEHICTLIATFYPDDFGQQEMYQLKLQFDHYKIDVVDHAEFQYLSTLSDLCLRLVDTGKTK
ncbi:uncharacterized protein LOC141674251 [Apium graveolens]|uniref:uncharacterized protein LOC141674251 n=1 Tax=Apium graveolens TaxID=4045 RepID=UPI003D78C648